MRTIVARLSPMASAVRIQARVIFALMLRETRTRYGRMRLGYMWAFMEPIIFISIFLVLFTLAGRASVSGMPLTTFLITGASTYIVFRDVMSVGMQAVKSNKALLTFPQVTVFDLVFARGLLDVATHYTAAVVLIVIVALISGPVQIEDPLAVTFWFMLAGALGLGAGFGLGSLAALYPSLEQLVPTFISRPLFFISGMFFTAEVLPDNIREFALINPLLHIIELVRSSFFKGFESPYASPQYVILFVLSIGCLGMVTHLALRRKILSLPPG